MCRSIAGSNTSFWPRTGAVVAGGTEAARDEDHIRALPTLPELRRNVLGVIRYRHIPLQLHPVRTQLRPYEREVPVGGESEQEFVAYGEQFVVEPMGWLFQTVGWKFAESILFG
jgi:hypothetical protein